jgi:hypothetical protein
MKKFIMIFISSLALNLSVEAALPPVYQSAKEFRALLDSPTLTEIIDSGEPIKIIIRDKNGFIVKTNKHLLKVDVVYDPMGQPGPVKFHLAFHELEPLD